MCHAPCCGTVEDIEALMDAGYGKRLMFDDWPDSRVDEVIKPSLKFFEGQRAPWDVSTALGCTFWRNGKCELHDSGLKPSQGKLALHGQSHKITEEIADFVCASWKTPKGKEVIDRWKKENNYK